MSTTDRAFSLYRATLTIATLVMVAISWPLWVDSPDFPRVPFFKGLPVVPGWVSWLVLAGLGIALGLALIGRWWRPMIGLAIGLLGFAVLQDQNRFQPWVYQFGLVGLGLIGLPERRALSLARWSTIGLYFYSGLSKLDASFCRELGPLFLQAALGPLGAHPETWPGWLQGAGSLTMPGFEIVVAGLLARQTTRRWGLAGTILIHGTLIAILGPWSLHHSAIVLVWNLAQILENLSLFGPKEPLDEPDREPWSRFEPVVWAVFGLAMVLPIGERWGFADAWPAHALYASHAERSDVYLHEDDVDRFPEAIRRRLAPADTSSWRRLDLTGWSRDVRGTPLYPSGRVGNAVAEFLEARYGGIQPVRLIQWGRASLGEGRRERDESQGIRSIRRRADRFRLNAHPSNATTPARNPG